MRKFLVQTVDGEPLPNMQVELSGVTLQTTDEEGVVWLPMTDGTLYDFKMRDLFTPRHFGPGYDNQPGDYWYHAYAEKLPENERHPIPGSSPVVYGMEPPFGMYARVILMKRYVCDAKTIFAPPGSSFVVDTCRQTTCGCAIPTENFPYGDDTFALVTELAGLVKSYGAKYGVPPVAIAGGIADEYNTRQGLHMLVDWFQDYLVIRWLPDIAIRVDVWYGADSRLANSTKNDLGKGNINLAKAMQLYKDNPDAFSGRKMNYHDLVKYICSDEGTVHLATLAILEGKRVLDPHLAGLTPQKKEAIYVTFYKQGLPMMKRFHDRVQAECKARGVSEADCAQLDAASVPAPGEGCRVCLQRPRFLQALGLPP